MKTIINKIKRFRKKLSSWLIRSTCTKEEWRTYTMVKAGYYTPERIGTSFEVTGQDHRLMSENVGKKYNERYCVTRRLLMDRADEIGQFVDYNSSYDPRREKWTYSAELKILGGM